MKKKYDGKSKSGGIYRITNLVNDKIYIGSCALFQQRASQHKSSLKRNCHQNKHLQNAWNKYGEDAFLFEAIEIVCGNREIRTTREQELINEQVQAGNWQNCYNISKETLSSDREYWSKDRDGFSEEHKQSLSKALKKHYKNNPEAKKAISKRMKGVQHRLGQTHTEDTRQKMSKSQKGRKHTEEAKIKISESHFGKVISKEIRKKISKANKGKTVSKKIRLKISEALKGRLTDPEERKQIYGRKKSEIERKKISKGQQGNINGSKKRNYDLRLAEAKAQFLSGIVPKKLSFDETERSFLTCEAKLVYKQWPRWVKNNPEKTAIRIKQRQQYKQWLIEQELWYDARSDSWTRKSPENQKKAVKILKENQGPPFGKL